jgi:hypothetical protein
MRAMLISQSPLGKRIVPVRETGVPDGKYGPGKPIPDGMGNDKDLGELLPGLRHLHFRIERKR